MLRRTLVSPRSDWREQVARDLDRPTFKLTFWEAVGVRLRHNYLWIYGVLLVAWLAKLTIHPAPAAGFGEVVGRMAVGPVPGGVVLGAVVAFYATAGWLALQPGRTRPALDEIRGLETSPDAWKA